MDGLRRLLRLLPRLLRRRPRRLERIHLFAAEFVCRDAAGAELWRVGGWVRGLPFLNRFLDHGEKLTLRSIFRGESVFGTAFFGRLYNDTPQDADGLLDLTGEPSSNGYQPQPWSRNTSDFGDPLLVGGQHETTGVKKSFSATGAGFGPVTSFVFATTSDNAGFPVAWFSLGEPRTVPGGASLDVQPRGMLRGVTS